MNERVSNPNAASSSANSHKPVFAHRGLFIEDKWGPDLMELADWQDIVDWMAENGMNTLTIGLYGCWTVQYNNQITEFLMVPLPGHPEINTPKTIRWYSALDEQWKSLEYLPRIYEQDFLGELVAYGQERGVEVSGLFNSLGHNTLIPRHIPQISAVDEDGKPTSYSYCLSNPETLQTVGGWYQQIWRKYFAPHGCKHFHLGLDEVTKEVGCDPRDWYRELDPWCKCEKCRQRPDGDLFIDYVIGLVQMLREVGVERIILMNDQMTRHMSFIDKFVERVREEGLEDHVVVEFWWYVPDQLDESVHPRLADGLRTWVMPMGCYYNWSWYRSNLDNIALMATVAEQEGAEGLHAYSVWDWAQEPEYALLAQCGQQGAKATEDFLPRYCSARFGSDASAVQRAIEVLREVAGNPSLHKTYYYQYTYIHPDEPYPRPYPQSALAALAEGDAYANLQQVVGLCRQARRDLAEVSDQADLVITNLTAELWRCQALAGCFAWLLTQEGTAEASQRGQSDNEAIPRTKEDARDLLLSAMREIEQRKVHYMVPSVLRDLSKLLPALE